MVGTDTTTNNISTTRLQGVLSPWSLSHYYEFIFCVCSDNQQILSNKKLNESKVESINYMKKKALGLIENSVKTNGFIKIFVIFLE